jgi:fructose-1,6-bisphosphatase
MAPKQRKKRLKSFTGYLEVGCWKRQELRDLEQVLLSVSDACKQINRIVRRVQTDDLYGVALGPDGMPLEDTNIQGEVQQHLDVLCNTIILRSFCGCSKSIASVASEEEDEPRSCADVMVCIVVCSSSCNTWCVDACLLSVISFTQHDNSFSVGDYIVAMDPIDGSKNIYASLPVGSIFGIYKAPPGKKVDETPFLQTGNNLVAAGYCLFS